MIKIIPQRNDIKKTTDFISFTEDTIRINDEVFEFDQGKDIVFEKIQEQIIDPFRDTNGILNAIIIKYYIEKDKNLFENKDLNISDLCDSDNRTLKYKNIKTRKVNIEKKKDEELIIEKLDLIKILKDKYIDADIEKNNELKNSIRSQINILKEDLDIIKEKNKNE